jgi:hypothetical protein
MNDDDLFMLMNNAANDNENATMIRLRAEVLEAFAAQNSGDPIVPVVLSQAQSLRRYLKARIA